MIGAIGFICPINGLSAEFGDCFKRCKARCRPLPLLHAYADQRELKDGVFSTTEILSPPQVGRLRRTKSYFIKPRQRTFATFGTGWHMVPESYMKFCPASHKSEDDLFFSADMGNGITLTGKPDYYDADEKVLYDYKTMKVYSVKKIKCGDWKSTTYGQQVNIYRHYRVPEATKIRISAVVKDHSRAVALKENIGEDEMIDVPIMSGGEIIRLVKERLALHTAETVRECTQDELWFPQNPRSPDYGKPLRCLEYCEVSGICPQYRKWLETHG